MDIGEKEYFAVLDNPTRFCEILRAKAVEAGILEE